MDRILEVELAEYEAQVRARAAAEADAATDGTRTSGGATDPVKTPLAVTPEAAAGPAADQDPVEFPTAVTPASAAGASDPVEPPPAVTPEAAAGPAAYQDPVEFPTAVTPASAAGATDPVEKPPLASGGATKPESDTAEDDTPASGGSLSCNVCLNVHNGLVWSSYRVM